MSPPSCQNWEKYITAALKLLLCFVVAVQVYAHAGAALDGKMYITCGRRGEDYLKELQCYDPRTDRWDVLADGPVRRAWHGMAALLGKLYVIGGSNNDSGYRRDVHQVRHGTPLSCLASLWMLVLRCIVFLLLSMQIKLSAQQWLLDKLSPTRLQNWQ